MKKIFLICALCFSSLGLANEYKFTTPGKDKAVVFPVSATNQDLALAAAAEKCFDHFTQGKAVSNDYGIDVINICANLRIKN